KKTFLITSEKNGYNHIYLYDLDGRELGQVTKGTWDVTRIIDYNEKDKVVYFESAEASSLRRNVYSTDLKGKTKICLTQREGVNKAEFFTNFNYFTNSYTSANTPPRISICDKTGKEIRTIVTNDSLQLLCKEYGFMPKEFITVKSEGELLNGWMIKPQGFTEGKKYPVFMYVYGGPGSQTVMDSWNYDMPWYQLLAQKGYIVVSVDNRGTGARGEKFKKMTYMQLGKYETIDQINAANYLAKQPYIDGDRIGIFGWSYGGYMSSLCILKGADVFKAAIAVAPVTNWRYYDNIYTERFMRTPRENADGYDSNSPIHYAGDLKGKYLLIHGTADDNVHFQNSIEFISELVASGKQFEVFFYPDSNHGMNQKGHRSHLYRLMTDFILRNL
ncbi:MAG: S9 family peptidase, partial [Bacteroidetes bacterium]|nr:S9 family peptidase [Bacteroidota bacterium]